MDIPSVIIVNGNPYTNPGIATGLAFGINEDSYIPPELSVLQDELAISYYHDVTFQMSKTEMSLEHWQEQGVMLLNCSLTCDPYTPENITALHKNGTHSYYWRNVLMEAFFEHMNKAFTNLVFVFLGEKAQYYNKFINIQDHCVLNVVHPVPDYRIGKDLFIGCKMFNSINNYLSSKKRNTIEWAKTVN